MPALCVVPNSADDTAEVRLATDATDATDALRLRSAPCWRWCCCCWWCWCQALMPACLCHLPVLLLLACLSLPMSKVLLTEPRKASASLPVSGASSGVVAGGARLCAPCPCAASPCAASRCGSATLDRRPRLDADALGCSAAVSTPPAACRFAELWEMKRCLAPELPACVGLAWNPRCAVPVAAAAAVRVLPSPGTMCSERHRRWE